MEFDWPGAILAPILLNIGLAERFDAGSGIPAGVV
jgi:hypothetical protein